MARALGDEMSKLPERLVTKSRLATEIGALRSDFTALDTRLSSKFDALSARFDALSAKVDALNMQVKFIFAILAVLLALGLIDTVPGMLS